MRREFLHNRWDVAQRYAQLIKSVNTGYFNVDIYSNIVIQFTEIVGWYHTKQKGNYNVE